MALKLGRLDQDARAKANKGLLVVLVWIADWISPVMMFKTIGSN